MTFGTCGPPAGEIEEDDRRPETPLLFFAVQELDLQLRFEICD